MSISRTHTFARIRQVYINRSEPEYARAFADLYWHTLLSVAVIVTIGACGYGTATFFGALSQLSSTASSAPSAAAAIPAAANLNRAALESTLAAFAARQAQFEALEQGPVPEAIDPSQ